MNAARRSIKRRGWPPNLYEHRPGYYSWRDPRNREEKALGYIPLAEAIHQALQANAFVKALKPTLLDHLTDRAHTVSELLDQMPVAEKENTAKGHKSMDGVIRAALGGKRCTELTVQDCAGLIDGIAAEDKARWAQAVRSRLVAVCRKGMAKGWMDDNPAERTENPKAVVKRDRLTLDQFRAVLAVAPQVAEWLEQAMLIAIVSIQDRDTIAAMKRNQVHDVKTEDGTPVRCLVVHRAKTEQHVQPVAIPLALRLNCLDLSLADVIARRTTVVSPFVIHHVKPWGNAPRGAPVAVDRFSHAFTEARKLAGIPDVMPNGKNAPTFHEIRSLGIRLYKQQGGVDTKTLASHTQDKTHARYQDPRGVEAIMVRIG